MQYAQARGADWRLMMATWLSDELGHTSIDPVQRSNDLMAKMRSSGARLNGNVRAGGDWPVFFRKVVEQDTALVAKHSDYLICLWNSSARRGAGTQGELTVARMNHIPVYVVSRTPLDKMPGWVQGCVSRHFAGWTALQSFLMDRYSR